MVVRYWLVGLLLIATPISAQHIHHHEGMTPEIDRFYSTWLMPNDGRERFYGCCNRIDCYPAEAQFRGGYWWFKHRETGKWIIVPAHKVEHDQPDARESPDGRTHVCASPQGNVFCFVVGLQT